MTTSKNRLRLDYKDLPELQSALGGLSPGDKCTIELELMVVSNDDNGLEGDIEGVEYEVPSAEGDSEEPDKGEVATSADEPVMAVIMRRKKSDAKKSSGTESMMDDGEDKEDV